MRALILIFALTACARGAIVVEKPPVIVKVPTTVPCVSGERPATVESIKAKHPDRAGYSVKQKAELVGSAGLRNKSYGQALNASTSACR